MMKLFLVLTLLVACAIATTKLELQFDQWMRRFNRQYTNENEKFYRMNVWRDNIFQIAALNKEAALQGRDTKWAVNKFSDLTADEFKMKYMGYKPSHPRLPPRTQPASNDHPMGIPTAFDWANNKSVVTPIKDQEQCGSCWAFSATEGLESAWGLAGNPIAVLAPQQIVDCDSSDSGCDGGDLPPAFAYLEQNGQEKEVDYPYTGEDGTCAYDASKVVAHMTGFQYATQNGNETQMLIDSFAHGPLSICVEADTWQSYTSGVITHDCGDALDHCVQITGWGVTKDKIPYWIIRNSWGSDWGLQGFIWVERNKDLCGVSDEATYVTI